MRKEKRKSPVKISNAFEYFWHSKVLENISVKNIATLKSCRLSFTLYLYNKLSTFSPMESVRQSKVAKLLQKELAEIFRANAKTLFDGAFITVTIVRISSDLSSAKIYVSIMANKDVDATFKSINEQKQHIRKLLGNTIGKQVRIIPELFFFIDDSYDYAEKINKLFNKPV